jgi:hypothetical protein
MLRIKTILKIKMMLFLKKILPYGLYKSIECRNREKSNINENEKYKFSYFHSKKASKEKYCIFRLVKPDYAVFAAGIQYIFACEYVRSKKFIPLLDLEYEYIFQQNNIGKENEWDACFEQEITVKEALKKDYVLVESFGMPNTWLSKMCIEINGEKDDHFIHAKKDNWRSYYAKINPYVQKWWIVKEEVMNDYVQKVGKKIRIENKIVGIALRELFSKDVKKHEDDSDTNLFANHPIMPRVEEILLVTKEYMKKWNCTKIFLSTQYQESLELFVKEFGENVIYLERERAEFSNYSSGIVMDESNRNAKKYYEYIKKQNSNLTKNVTIPYVQEVIGLSECDFLIAAKCSGSIAALSLNGGKYQDIYILPDKNNISRY